MAINLKEVIAPIKYNLGRKLPKNLHAQRVQNY
jgi:hypothetical protein